MRIGIRLTGGLAVLLAVPVSGQAALEPGMSLRYEASGGTVQVWVVEEVEDGLVVAGQAGCHRVRYAPGGPRPEADVRVTCLTPGILMGWSEEAGSLRPLRPIGPRDSMDVAGPRGVTRYLTGALATDTVGAAVVAVVETTILTVGEDGTIRRRLQERFAPSLGTATWGRFEVPDSAQATGWRVVQEFWLREIRAPGR